MNMYILCWGGQLLSVQRKQCRSWYDHFLGTYIHTRSYITFIPTMYLNVTNKTFCSLLSRIKKKLRYVQTIHSREDEVIEMK